MKTINRLNSALGMFWLCLAPASLLAQGTLTPPGAPGPTMKTLDQIEPRTPISALPYVISNSGSYYVTGNLTGIAVSNGITITADFVQLDLMGFTLTGAAGSGSGITATSGRVSLVVHNGSLRNWSGFGINVTNTSGGHFERLQATSNGSGGLAIGASSLLNNCVVVSNLLNGITAGEGCSIRDCTARTNTGSGIVVGRGSSVTSSTSMLNSNWGIVASDNCSLRSCSAISNCINPNPLQPAGGILSGNAATISGCIANNNRPVTTFSGSRVGISAGTDCRIESCIVNGNDPGIATGARCYVKDCIASGNLPAFGTGISVGDFSMVRDCLANTNAYVGIAVGNYCYVADNACSGNDNNYEIDVTGSFNTVVRNHVPTNSIGRTISTNAGGTNLIGTIEGSATANVNKNPHANFKN